MKTAALAVLLLAGSARAQGTPPPAEVQAVIVTVHLLAAGTFETLLLLPLLRDEIPHRALVINGLVFGGLSLLMGAFFGGWGIVDPTIAGWVVGLSFGGAIVGMGTVLTAGYAAYKRETGLLAPALSPATPEAPLRPPSIRVSPWIARGARNETASGVSLSGALPW